MTKLAFVDCETTGLDPDRHEVWEVGLILRDEDGDEDEYLWHLPVDLGEAEAIALTIGRFYERWAGYLRADGKRHDPSLPVYEDRPVFVDRSTFAATFAKLTHGAHMVGAVPSFDDAFLKRLLRATGACPGWHYHLIDVEALAAGWLAGLPDDHPAAMAASGVEVPPWNSNELSRAVGVSPDDYDRHTALGDARWAKAIFDAVMGGDARWAKAIFDAVMGEA